MESKKLGTKNGFRHVGIVVKSVSDAIYKYAVALGIDNDKVVVEIDTCVTKKPTIL